MRARSLVLVLAATLPAVALLVVPGVAVGADPGWLTEVNRVRTESGLDPVTIDGTRVPGMKKHVYYLDHDKAYQTGQYANQHDENPSAPDHSDAGRAAGEASVIAFATRDDAAAVDSWLAAPIHTADLLKPDLAQVAFYRDPASGTAMLFTDGGLAGTDRRVLYPGDGGTTHLTRFGGENPDPTRSCPAGFAHGAGLPVLAILPTPPASASAASLTGPRGGVPVCVVDRNDFDASDPVYGATAQQYFDNGLVLVIPKTPLVPGTYHVELRPGGQAAIDWSFTSNPRAMPPTLGYAVRCSFTNPRYASGQAQVGIDNPPDTTHAATYTVTVGDAHRTVTVADGKSGHTKPFTRLRAGRGYLATVRGNDHTGATERIKVPGCPAWAAVRPGRVHYAARKHELVQVVSNVRNLAAVRFTVKRSGLRTLRTTIRGTRQKTLHIGVHPHGATRLRYLVGPHTVYRWSIRLP